MSKVIGPSEIFQASDHLLLTGIFCSFQLVFTLLNFDCQFILEFKFLHLTYSLCSQQMQKKQQNIVSSTKWAKRNQNLGVPLECRGAHYILTSPQSPSTTSPSKTPLSQITNLLPWPTHGPSLHQPSPMKVASTLLRPQCGKFV